MIVEFGSLLTPYDIGQNQTPMLVLDTFEEVQYRSRVFVKALFDFLEELQHIAPRLRTVILGRAPVRLEDYQTYELELSRWDPEIARNFLQAHGVTEPAQADRIARQFKYIPLSLKLAADVIRAEGVQGLSDIETRRYWVREVEDNLIQGQLYSRILNRIHDPEVQKLANPGLVLRRVTPELIQHVLAGPCNVRVPNAETAQHLFLELSREVSLVDNT